jgi:hypothetical protein
MFHRTRTALATTVLSLGLVVSAAAPAAALPDWRTDSTTRQGHPARIVDLRYAAHGSFDRVVIDIPGPRRPGFTIDYTKRLFREGSGQPVKLRGKRKMFLSLTPAYAHNGRGNSIYDGPRRRNLDLPTLRGVAFTGDFEGYVTFGFGLDRRAPYRIFTLHQPTRIVVDFKH